MICQYEIIDFLLHLYHIFKICFGHFEFGCEMARCESMEMKIGVYTPCDLNDSIPERIFYIIETNEQNKT